MLHSEKMRYLANALNFNFLTLLYLLFHHYYFLSIIYNNRLSLWINKVFLKLKYFQVQYFFFIQIVFFLQVIEIMHVWSRYNIYIQRICFLFISICSFFYKYIKSLKFLFQYSVYFDLMFLNDEFDCKKWKEDLVWYHVSFNKCTNIWRCPIKESSENNRPLCL